LGSLGRAELLLRLMGVALPRHASAGTRRSGCSGVGCRAGATAGGGTTCSTTLVRRVSWIRDG